MTDGLSAVLSRVSQIESLLSPGASGGQVGASGATGFDAAMNSTGTGSSAGTGAGTAGGSLGEAAVSIAGRYLGTPYRWGGTDPQTGLDCSGFTQLVFRQLGVNLPRTSAEQAGSGVAVASLDQAQRGDLLFFGSPVHHVGIYLGDGMMIDSPHTGSKVKIEHVWGTPSQIRRVLPSATSSLGAQAFSGIQSPSTGQAFAASRSSSGLGSLGGSAYAGLFAAAGQRYGVDPALLSAVAKAESGYRPDAVSAAGARGLMQLMPATARALGVDPNDPAQAVDGAARLLADNLRNFNGRVDLALAAYNAGPAAVRTYNGIPPYTETRSYVQRVQTYWGQLR